MKKTTSEAVQGDLTNLIAEYHLQMASVGRSINGDYYCEVIDRRSTIRRSSGATIQDAFVAMQHVLTGQGSTAAPF